METKFRTAQDDERTKRAAEVVATKQATFDAASAALATAEEACATAPTDKSFAKAKDARRTLEDAERDLTLARQHASHVESEIAAAEQARITAEIARRKRDLTTVVDDEAREAAVEIAALAAQLRQRTLSRIGERRAEIEGLNQLRARLGERAEDVPSVASLTIAAVHELAEIGLSAQAQRGLRSREIDGCFAAWREGGAIGPKEFYPGNDRPTVGGTRPDGTPITWGRDATHIVAAAAKLLERVEARRAAILSSTKGSAIGIAAKAAVGALGLLAAFTMAGGG